MMEEFLNMKYFFADKDIVNTSFIYSEKFQVVKIKKVRLFRSFHKPESV